MLAGLVTDTAEKHKQSAAMVVSNREVMVFSFRISNYFAAPVFGGAAWRRVSIGLSRIARGPLSLCEESYDWGFWLSSPVCCGDRVFVVQNTQAIKCFQKLVSLI